jgi:hypothetical protein
MREKLLKIEEGWRIGWNPHNDRYPALLGGEDWAMELTEAELNDFCRLLEKLTATMSQMASELMEEEKIACEAESDLLWLEVEGYPHAYSLRVILNSGRRCEGNWTETAVSGLVEGIKLLKVGQPI